MLTYPIPDPGGSELCNWLWYRNVTPGDQLTDLLTDRNGFKAELTVPPGSVQTKHLEELHSAADTELPAPLTKLVQRSAEPFVQVIVDLEVPRIAFGRTCLIGDAAFALRPHIGAGTAKAADGAWQLGNALLHTTGRQIPVRLRGWEAQQLATARDALQRARAAGQSVQFEGPWRVGDPTPFGLHAAGDSTLPVVEQKGIPNARTFGPRRSALLEGTARYRWGDRLQHVVEAGPGDFVFIPANTVHQEINASADRPTVWVVTRSDPDPIVVNLPELDKFAEPAAREYPHP